MIKIGVIGLGNWGKRILPKLLNFGEVISCSNNSNINTPDWLLKHYPNISHTFNYREILNNSEIDTVVIATPIGTHYEIVKLAVKAGKHVFVEKPLTSSSIKTLQLIKMAKSKNLALCVGYIYTHNEIIKILNEINTHERISHISMEWLKYGSFESDIFWNFLTHELSIIYKIIGPDISSFKIEKIEGKITNADIVILTLNYSKVKISINFNRVSKTKHKSLDIITYSGNRYVWTDNLLYQETSPKSRKEIHVSNLDLLSKELEIFTEQISTGKFAYETEMHLFISEIIEAVTLVD